MLPHASPRILAVDDDVSSAELIVRVAERSGYEGFATSDSRGVLNLTNALKPAVLSVDICMPNIDAHELFHLLCNSNYAGKILIISGQEPTILEGAKVHAEALGLDVLGALQKPIEIASLRALLNAQKAPSKSEAA